MELIPIAKTAEENKHFFDHRQCRDTISMSLDFYDRIGFNPPWIGYYAKKGENFVGSGGFKGKPLRGKIEIAYGTFEQYRNQGIGTEICRHLVLLSLSTDPEIKITARTLLDNNESMRVLLKNNFRLAGIVNDEEDGEVYEWEYVSDISLSSDLMVKV